MSFKATNWAVSQRGIDPYSKVVLWQLADRHNPDNGCFPDQHTLARDCEFVRSTVNKYLLILEQKGLIRREIRVHPVTKRKLPTRYIFAFEDDFHAVDGEAHMPSADIDDEESHVRSTDMENEASHVRETGEAMSAKSAEPCPPARTHNESLTCKITSKGTSKRVERDIDLEFDKIWKMFPMRPGSDPLKARAAFEALDAVDAARCIKGVERFAAWFKEQVATSGESFAEKVQYAKYLSNWIAEQGWIAAVALPVKYGPGTDAAQAMEGLENINKFAHPALFAACERVLGRSLPVGGSGTRSFAKEVVEKARKLLGSQSGVSPP